MGEIQVKIVNGVRCLRVVVVEKDGTESTELIAFSDLRDFLDSQT